MDIRILKSPPELEAGYTVLKELRTHLTFTEFLTTYKAAHQADGYTLAPTSHQISTTEGDMPDILGVLGLRKLNIAHGYASPSQPCGCPNYRASHPPRYEIW